MWQCGGQRSRVNQSLKADHRRLPGQEEQQQQKEREHDIFNQRRCRFGPRVSPVIRLFNILRLNIPIDKVMMLMFLCFRELEETSTVYTKRIGPEKIGKGK